MFPSELLALFEESLGQGGSASSLTFYFFCKATSHFTLTFNSAEDCLGRRQSTPNTFFAQ